MPRDDIRYDLVLRYETVGRTGDPDITGEDWLPPRLAPSPGGALGTLGSFITLNGGPSAWEQVDPHQIASRRLPNDETSEISYRARLERVTLPPGGGGRLTLPAAREPAMLTWNRVNAASFGELGRRCAGGIDEEIDGMDLGGEE